VCANFTAKREDCAQVDLQDIVPVIVGELMRRVAALDPAAVEQDVDVVAVFKNLGNESVD
jgi:hypothetical protein